MACDDCNEVRPVMIAMKPGKDGEPWELCGVCWLEGRKPMKLGHFTITPIADPHLYDALVSASKRTAGLIDHGSDAPDDPKASVGDFDRKPRKATRSRRA